MSAAVIIYQLVFVCLIIGSSFGGVKVLLKVVLGSIAFTMLHVFFIWLFALQLAVILCSAVIGLVIALIVDGVRLSKRTSIEARAPRKKFSQEEINQYRSASNQLILFFILCTFITTMGLTYILYFNNANSGGVLYALNYVVGLLIILSTMLMIIKLLDTPLFDGCLPALLIFIGYLYLANTIAEKLVIYIQSLMISS